jgi:hypothetical protein
MQTRTKYSWGSALVLALLMVGFSYGAELQPRRSGKELPLSKARLFFELNHTDGDLGIHAQLDGDAWSALAIEDPKGRVILRIVASGRLRQQGMTEVAFESAEPAFDELPPAEFFKRFPEGEYEVEAISLEGDELEGEAMLSHVLAAPAGNITVSGVLLPANCDQELPVIDGPAVVAWDPVTTSHPTIGRSGPVTISSYELIVESDNGDMTVELPPNVTEFEIPEELLELATEFKVEIIARTTTGNNTAVETCFVTE